MKHVTSLRRAMLAAALSAGLAVSPWMLVAARVVQGIGAAAMGPAFAG